MRKKLHWFYPGLGIKRWIFLAVVGIAFISLSSASIVKSNNIEESIFSFLGVALGTLAIIVSVKELITAVINVLYPQRSRKLVDIFLEKKQRDKGANIVALGGGTGLSALLQGLKNVTANTTAIVTVADDGGSSGRIREEFNILPPGDIRNCLVALADAEPLMQELFQYRFKSEGDLKNHNFGNLFITALSQITGDFEKAVKESSRVLAIKGQVLPVTVDKIKLIAEHVDGRKTIGESQIPKTGSRIKNVYIDPANCKPSYEVIEAIANAEAIIFGPGSLYTSILPNLLVPGILDAVSASRAVKIYVCNIMTQLGETDSYCASDHIKALIEHTTPGLMKYCILNSSFIPEHLLKKYEEEGAYPVEADVMNIEQMGFTPVVKDLAHLGDVVRHKSKNLADVILEIINMDKGRDK
ncbi:MAG: YvcK family protein [Candidatus Saelkia tenebricola]|nr:YvcK family protein [Candidatus Saelkia tenebricola]